MFISKAVRTSNIALGNLAINVGYCITLIVHSLHTTCIPTYMYIHSRGIYIYIPFHPMKTFDLCTSHNIKAYK